jgi:hypothetical protein
MYDVPAIRRHFHDDAACALPPFVIFMTMPPVLSLHFEQLQAVGIILQFQDVAFGRHEFGLVDPPQLAPVPFLLELDLQDPAVEILVDVRKELLQGDDLMGFEGLVEIILVVTRHTGPGRHEKARREGHREHRRAHSEAAQA